MRIEKTMWRILRSIVSSHHRIRRRAMARSTVEKTYVGKVYATVKLITSNDVSPPAPILYDITEYSVVGRAPSTITSLISESVRKATTVKEESQIKKASNTIKNVSSERVRFQTGVHLDSTVVTKTVMNIIFISSEEV